jgi:hypothetical protein
MHPDSLSEIDPLGDSWAYFGGQWLLQDLETSLSFPCKLLFLLRVRTEGLEPSRELPRQNLNLVRLPIPPRSREARGGLTGRPDPVKQSAVDATCKARYRRA